MYQNRDFVLCQVHAAFNAGATTLQLKALAGTPPWKLPPACTDAGAGTPTYGAPFVILTLMDTLNQAAAKIEQIRCKFSGQDIGSGVYEATSCERGFGGTTDQAWAPGSLVLMQVTAAHLAMEMETAVMRAQFAVTHNLGLMSWDGASFKWSRFRFAGVGRGPHMNLAGYVDISLPADGSTVKGYGGAADHVVAGGDIAIPAYHALYYEPSIGAASEISIAANFRLVSVTSDFVVPKHWLLIAHHAEVSSAGELGLRVCTGVTLHPWRAVGAGGQPAFANSWVNFGIGEQDVQFIKSADQIVRLRGVMKSGTVTAAAFYLPTGYRPAAKHYFPVLSNSALGILRIDLDGGVVLQSGSNSSVILDHVFFQASA